MSPEPVIMPSLTSGMDEAWLTLTQEAVLEPDLPICDPHHHLWDGREFRSRPGTVSWSAANTTRDVNELWSASYSLRGSVCEKRCSI